MANLTLYVDDREDIILNEYYNSHYNAYYHYSKQEYSLIADVIKDIEKKLLSKIIKSYGDSSKDFVELYEIQENGTSFILSLVKDNYFDDHLIANYFEDNEISDIVDGINDKRDPKEFNKWGSWRLFGPSNHDLESLDIFKKLVSLPSKTKSPKNNLYLVSQTQNGQLYLKEFNITSKIEIDIDTNYNEDFKVIDSTIREKIANTNKGIILLHGKPGTGKTSYIKWLLQTTPKKIVFLPPNLADSLSMPSFVDFVTDECKDSLIVIEDAENVLKARDHSENSSVSNILNMTDGLLSEIFNIQILATFNSKFTEIDKALTRQGRIIVEYEFDELSVERAQKLSDKLGHETKIEKPMLLTAIYNQKELDFSQSQSRPKVGFV